MCGQITSVKICHKTVINRSSEIRLVATFLFFNAKEKEKNSERKARGSSVYLSRDSFLRSKILGLQPRDKAAMLGDKTKENFAEF